jgi:hypothetical protein
MKSKKTESKSQRSSAKQTQRDAWWKKAKEPRRLAAAETKDAFSRYLRMAVKE